MSSAPALHDASDVEILDAIATGDVACFEALMRRHNQLIYRTVRSMLPEADAEEAMQRTYLAAFKKIDSFQRRSKFSTWLVKIAINTAGQIRREQQRAERNEAAAGAEVFELRQESPETSIARAQLRDLLERSIDRLSSKNRTAFILSDVQGLSGPEVAEILGINEETVRARLSRARQQLRAQLERVMGEVTSETFSFYRPRCDRVVRDVLTSLMNEE